MTFGIAIAGFVAGVASAFGGAWFGARLQRTSDTEHLALQLQIDSAAKFIGSAGEFQVVHGAAWAPGTEHLTMTERQMPLLGAIFSLRSTAALVSIAGPDELSAIAEEFVTTSLDKGLATSFDVACVTELGVLTQRFIDQAKSLRPGVRQKNG